MEQAFLSIKVHLIKLPDPMIFDPMIFDPMIFLMGSVTFVFLDIALHDKTGQIEEGYVAKDVGSAILVIASLLKEVDPPKFYNRNPKPR